jgi:hypothetical protein
MVPRIEWTKKFFAGFSPRNGSSFSTIAIDIVPHANGGVLFSDLVESSYDQRFGQTYNCRVLRISSSGDSLYTAILPHQVKDYGNGFSNTPFVGPRFLGEDPNNPGNQLIFNLNTKINVFQDTIFYFGRSHMISLDSSGAIYDSTRVSDSAFWKFKMESSFRIPGTNSAIIAISSESGGRPSYRIQKVELPYMFVYWKRELSPHPTYTGAPKVFAYPGKRIFVTGTAGPSVVLMKLDSAGNSQAGAVLLTSPRNARVEESNALPLPGGRMAVFMQYNQIGIQGQPGYQPDGNSLAVVDTLGNLIWAKRQVLSATVSESPIFGANTDGSFCVFQKPDVIRYRGYDSTVLARWTLSQEMNIATYEPGTDAAYVAGSGRALINNRYTNFNFVAKLSGFGNQYVPTATAGPRAAQVHTINLFPNPAKGSFMVRGLAVKTPATLHDLAGRVLWQGTIRPGQAIHPPQVTPGLYFLRLPTSTHQIVLE